MSTIPTSVANPTDQLLPPVPLRIREWIIKGEYIDFAMLLLKAMFSGGSEPDCSTSFTVQLPNSTGDFSVRQTPKAKKITSFSSWMEAWNIFLAVWIDHMPSKAPSLVAYQHIITSANNLYPLESWLDSDVQFRTLAASNPSLRWDTGHPDLWLQCLTPLSAQKSLSSSSTQNPRRWPCPHCGAVTHYPTIVLFVPPLQSSLLIDNGMLTEGNQTHNLPVTQPFTNILYQPIQTENAASITTALHATANTAGLPIIAKPVVAITQLEVAPNQQPLKLPTGPQPWTPIRSFLLECEVSSYPDKIFVRQFIDDLQLGCSIGYTGPQFAHLANNLPSAYQQPSVIDATLEKECEAGRILGPFQTPHWKTFVLQDLV